MSKSTKNDPRPGRQRRSRTAAPMQHRLNLVDYLDELADVKEESQDNLSAAGERALKVLDGYLADLAGALGMRNERASMGDSIRFLESLSGTPAVIAGFAEQVRDTRNAVVHNPDIQLRPEAAERIIEGVETMIRMAAEVARDMARSRVVTADANEPLINARDRMLEHGYNQLIVVDQRGGVIDLLTERDLVIMEADDDLDLNEITVSEALERREHPAIALLSRQGTTQEATALLRNEQHGAVVLTENGRVGERPLGIITRGDILRSL